MYGLVNRVYDEQAIWWRNIPGSEEKLTACKDLGADVCIDYKTEDFVACVKEETQGKGVDVILDNVGGPYFQRNIDSLNVDGRLFTIGFMGGTVADRSESSRFACKAPHSASGWVALQEYRKQSSDRQRSGEERLAGNCGGEGETSGIQVSSIV